MTDSAPLPEQALATNTESTLRHPQDPALSEPLAEEPLAVDSSKASSNEEKVVEKEVAEDSSSSNDDDEKDRNIVRPAVERTHSTWTTTSAATSIARPEEQPPRKQTWGEKLNPLKHKTLPPIPEQRAVSREYGAGFFNKLYFQWMAPLMSVGYQRPLEVNDVWRVNPDRSVEKLQPMLEEALRKRKASGSKNPLPMALYDTFKTEFLIGGACQLTAACVQVLSPFTMKYLIAFAGEAYYAVHDHTPAPSIGRGVGLVIGITCMQMIQSITTNHFIYRGMTVGGQARGALIAIIFDKAMKLSGRAKAGGKAEDAKMETPEGMVPGSKEEKKFLKKKLGKGAQGKSGVVGDGEGWSNGRIVNLMSTDTYRVDLASGMFHMVWTSPIQIMLTLALLLINLTYSALAGFAFICLCMPLLAKSIKSLMARRKFINKITDQRVSLTQEIISSVRFVKFFGWEMSFIDRLAEIRTREINKISFLLSIRNGIMAVSMTMPIFASMLAFITFSLTKHPLNPAPVFSSLALFNAMRIPLNLLPMVIGQVVDANASLGRIQEFLDAEELEDEAEWNYEMKNAISLRDAEFTWERTSTQNTDRKPGQDPKGMKQEKMEKKQAKKDAKEEKRKSKQMDKEKLGSVPQTPTSPATSISPQSPIAGEESEDHPFHIRDINLDVGRNELIAVIGSVGSGKSSLLGALAGDMRRTTGNMILGASRAFCPQYAWIQNATVKQNIVFGKEYDSRWYNEVIDACALRPDLDMLPSGDMTEIGERGITVSGGQKQRLNIARAIYFNADIVLMDDPLSAVDAHVGRHIMDNAICGLMRDKCRVLATHQLHVLHRVDRIVWMKEGGIYKVATFNELMEHDTEFQKLMETTAVEQKTEAAEHDGDEHEDEKKVVQRKKGKKPAGALMQVEERAVKGVGWDVYKAYIQASGTIWNLPLVLLILLLSQGANIVTSLWLSYWTSSRWHLPLGVYIGVYAALGVVQATLLFIWSVALTVLGTRASKVMLHRAVRRVLRAPMSFFDTTPLGRITNRFSKDVDTMDNTLTDSMRMFFMTMAMICSVFILIIAYYYYFVIALVPLTVMFLFSAGYYRASAREIKRHEAVLRSAVFSRFGEAVTGTSTIRAYGLQKQFAKSVNDARWLSSRLDVVGNLLVFTVGILVVTSRFAINPSTGGLVLSYILTIVQMIQFTVRQLAEVENNMNSTERIHYYGTELEEEAPLHLAEVRPTWPEKGEIVFNKVEMRYRAGLPLVLKGLSMHVQGGERIGVVGRTGAGKSSIMSTVFRLIELSGGSIRIDGVDIATVGLHDLRSRLAIIPQDPTLFRGTIRSNLDPFDEHDDLKLWNALRQADLVGSEQAIEDESGRIHLDTTVEDEGLNFSLGQRQLLALARALVRGSQIIVCDEATSSVDFETDQKIQKTIVRGFKGKTLLCIAHRLKTIIGYDRILVMDAGNVAELDTPLRLYDQPGGIFRSMCERSGIGRQDFFESVEARLGEESPVLERSLSQVVVAGEQ